MIADRPYPRRRRPGFGTVEMAIGALMLAAAMVATVQVVGWVAADRRAVGRRQRAVVEASNLLERIAARSWAEITPEALSALKLNEATAASLPDASLAIAVAPLDDAPARKKITVTIRWRGEAPARLVGWVHRPGGLDR